MRLPAGPAPRGTSTLTALETDRLTLRRLSRADAGALFRISGDPLVMRYWAPGPDGDEAQAEARITEINDHWRRHGFGDYAVLERDSEDLVGFAGLHCIPGMAEVNVGYALASSCWRQDLGSELCRRLLAHGFEELELPQIVAVIDPANVASRSLAARCGLRLWKEATWQGNLRVVYSTTREDWQSRVPATCEQGGRPC